MKQNYYFAIILAIVLLSCKKQSPNSLLSSASPSPSDFTIPITHGQAVILNTLLAQGKIKSSADLRAKVDSLKWAHVGENGDNLRTIVTGGSTNPYDPAQDELNVALNFVDSAGAVVEEDPIIYGKRTVASSFQRYLTFPKRGNMIEVDVPFKYIWNSFGYNAISQITASTPVRLLGVGNFWGGITQGTTQYVNGGIDDPNGQYAGITAHGSAEEKRTLITSVNNQVKLSLDLNLEAFKAGTELGAGFTIQSAAYTYNQYTMDTNGQIHIASGPLQPGQAAPPTNFSGTILCTNNGILKNQ